MGRLLSLGVLMLRFGGYLGLFISLAALRWELRIVTWCKVSID